MIVGWLFAALAVLLLGYLDRLRGSGGYGLVRGTNAPDTLLQGLLVAWLAGVDEPVPALACALLWLVGERPGWGEPLGAHLHRRAMRPEQLEWWQLGALKRSAALACLFRGMLWGLPCLALLPWAPQVALVPLASGLAFALAPLLARRLHATDQWRWPLPPTEKGRWDKAEALRGWLLGALLFVGG